MAQPATSARAEPNEARGNSNKNQPMTTKTGPQTRGSPGNEEGEAFKDWWRTQLAHPNRKGPKAGWNENNITHKKNGKRHKIWEARPENRDITAYQPEKTREEYDKETLEMVSDQIVLIPLQAIRVCPTQPWYKEQTFPDTRDDVNEEKTDLQEERHVQTSVGTAKAVAGVTTGLDSNKSTGKIQPRHSVETPKVDKTTTFHQREYETTRKTTDDKNRDSLDWAEIEEMTEDYTQEYGDHRREESKKKENSMPWRRQRSNDSESNTHTESGGKESKRYYHPVTPPPQNPVTTQKPTQPTHEPTTEPTKQSEGGKLPTEDVLILELIIEIPDAKLRDEIINRAGNADYGELENIVKNWHYAGSIRTMLGLGENKSGDGLTEEKTEVLKLGNGKSNVKLHQEPDQASDRGYRKLDRTTDTRPKNEITQTRPARERTKEEKHNAPVYTQRVNEKRLWRATRGREGKIERQDRSGNRYRQTERTE